jgi:hypothetical protein
MSYSVKLTFILVSFTLLPVALFASDAESYEAYEKRVKETCETDKPWAEKKEWWGNIVAIPKYSELTKVAIEKRIQNIVNAQRSPEEQERIERDLEIGRIANLETFKVLEVARVDYRTAMNNVFGCAVIQSREDMLKNLINEISKKYPTPQTEIKEKLRIEWEKLKIQKDNLSCIDQSWEKNTPQSTRLVNSSIRQYCHYDAYLRYLRSYLDKENTKMLELESSIGKAPGEKIVLPTNTEVWTREIAKRSEYISSEIARAKLVLPRALEAFREMERTYRMHLMLVIIYDDYLRLRDNLSTYFNAVTQLMEKMLNAQLQNNK